MDKKTREALDAINKVKSSDDIIYEVFRSEKRSGWFHFWDTIFDVIPSTTTKLLNNKVMYLLASEKSGKIIEVENGTIVYCKIKVQTSAKNLYRVLHYFCA